MQGPALLLEFLLAAGLLRLVHGAICAGLATAALIVVIRELVSFGFSTGRREEPVPSAVRTRSHGGCGHSLR